MGSQLQDTGLEHLLSQLEKHVDNLIKTAGEASSSLKQARTAVKVGNLVKLRKAMEDADHATLQLRQNFTLVHQEWDLDEVAYLSSQAYRRDLLKMGKQLGLDVLEHEGSLFSYPVLLRILPKERAITIDRSRETRLRPSVVMNRIKDLQTQPPRFKPQAFLEVLFSAYCIAVGMRGKHLLGTGLVIPLMELYDLLTLLPWESSSYSKQEFARDIYFLDRSGESKTKKGQRLNFHASTGIRDPTRILNVVTHSGRTKTYYATSFVKEHS